MWLLSWMVSYNCKMVSAVDQTSSEMFYPKPVTWRRKRAHQQYFGTNDQRCQPQAREGKNKKVHLELEVSSETGKFSAIKKSTSKVYTALILNLSVAFQWHAISDACTVNYLRTCTSNRH